MSIELTGRYILVHTDGSCIGNPGPGGWAVVLQSMDGSLQLNQKELSGHVPDTTNNRMELSAAIAALEAIKNKELPVIIRTDSSYLANGMTKWLEGWKRQGWKNRDGKPVPNWDLWERLDIFNDRRVHWQWVRAHDGNELNEVADKLAKAAAHSAP